ncbi:MAG: hypothetical protein KAY32_02805 [Candidatus Eisenbacteria sp.]|nr:hypothetical protein [Candidatus Eisenbacteria bacterium]
MSDRVQRLAQLQDLELMIREVEDPASKMKEEALGFSVEGLAQLQNARSRLLKQIPKQDLRAYQRIRRKYDRAVVPVMNRICLGCFQALPTSVTRNVSEAGPLPICENCGRILYWL